MELIEIENCKPGYILRGYLNHKQKGHYIVFIEPYHFPDFIGAMISTKVYDNKNILMSETHFNENFDDGSKCKIIFDDSHLVIAKLHKFFDMGPFELCGVLSENGINFVSKNLENIDIENWEQYLERTNNIQ